MYICTSLFLEPLILAVLFQEAFDHSGRTLNIIVSPKNNLTDPPRLLNYLTAPHVLVWSAVVCSCSVPGLFGAFSLLVSARIIFSCACFFRMCVVYDFDQHFALHLFCFFSFVHIHPHCIVCELAECCQFHARSYCYFEYYTLTFFLDFLYCLSWLISTFLLIVIIQVKEENGSIRPEKAVGNTSVVAFPHVFIYYLFPCLALLICLVFDLW